LEAIKPLPPKEEVEVSGWSSTSIAGT